MSLEVREEVALLGMCLNRDIVFWSSFFIILRPFHFTCVPPADIWVWFGLLFQLAPCPLGIFFHVVVRWLVERAHWGWEPALHPPSSSASSSTAPGTSEGEGLHARPLPHMFDGYINVVAVFFGGGRIALRPSSSQLRRVPRGRRDRPSSSRCWWLPRRGRDRPSSSQCRCVLRRRRDRPSSSQRRYVRRRRGDRPPSSY